MFIVTVTVMVGGGEKGGNSVEELWTFSLKSAYKGVGPWGGGVVV
jgi:hypothetical protein